MAKRGRPIGATSKLKNPENVVAHYTSHLMECWLAGVPIQIDPDCWLVQPTRRRHTVPQTIQRTLCKLAIAHVMRLHQQTQAAALEIDDSLRRSKAHAGAVLRRQGWTDEQIAAWFKKLQVASGRRVQREFRVPTVKAELVEFVKAVLALVERKTPRYTARRKASERFHARKYGIGNEWTLTWPGASGARSGPGRPTATERSAPAEPRTDERIAAHFKRLQIARERRAHREFEVPDLTAVLAAVNRRAPERTLRRKASERKRRKAAK